MNYKNKYRISLGFLVLSSVVILIALFSLFENKFFQAINFFVFWGNGRLIDIAGLIISLITLFGLFLAFWQYREKSVRQNKIDSNSVSIRVGNGDSANLGIFEVSNYGNIPHRIRIQKAILNDGNITPISTEDVNPCYKEVFSGTIKPRQIIEMHLFNIDATNLFVFRGAVKIITNKKEITLVKVRFSGGAAEKISDSFDVHPIGRWVIYHQDENMILDK